MMNRYSTNSTINPVENTTVSGAVRFTSVQTFTRPQGAIRYGNGARFDQVAGWAGGGRISRTGDAASVMWDNPHSAAVNVLPAIDGIGIAADFPLSSVAFTENDEFERGVAAVTLCRVAPLLIGTFSVSVSVFPRFGTISYPAISS